MMKISVRVKGEWFAVPVPEPSNLTVKWLGDETLRKYLKLRHNKYGQTESIENESFYEIRKAKGGAILDPEDLIAHVLDDNDFVSLGEWVVCLLFVVVLLIYSYYGLIAF